ncbi:MAG: DUF4253 domain-containing protein [Candidatus Gastranaerophilales bacterium]|nr:DUF4253 domain-containing protein [Candidatus Gastranaerophilales bacterium]
MDDAAKRRLKEAAQRTGAQEFAAGKHLLEEGRYAYAWYRLNHVYDFYTKEVPFPELESLLAKCEEGMGWPRREPELVELFKRYLGCPFRLFTPQPDPHKHMEAYKRAWKTGKTHGFVPVFISVNGTEHLLQMLVDNADPKAGDIRNFSPERVAAYRKSLLETPLPDAEEILKKAAVKMNLHEEAKEFGVMEAGESEHNVFWSLFGFGSNEFSETPPTKQVMLAKIPVQNPWEVFAWLPMGNWNCAPGPLEMMAVAKSWYERFGVVPAAVSGDEVEFYMDIPAGRGRTKAELEALAFEHLAFAPDTWEGCVIDTSCLKKCRYWYFWWD